MAVTSLRDQLRQMIARHLGKTERYRSVLLQSPDVALLGTIARELSAVLDDQAQPPRCLTATDLFDHIGAVSCHDLVDRIGKECDERYVLITGPLNFLDYWSPSIRSGFWTYLAALMRSPGVILFDTPREDNPDCFRAADRFNGFDVKVLKSRLALTRGHVV